MKMKSNLKCYGRKQSENSITRSHVKRLTERQNYLMEENHTVRKTLHFSVVLKRELLKAKHKEHDILTF